MSGTAQVSVTATLTGGLTSQKQYGPVTFSNTAANEQTQNVAVGTNTTITIPTTPVQATGVIIIPPTSNTNILTLKGVAGDTGIAIAPAAPTFIPFATAVPASFVLNAASTTQVIFWWV